MRTPTGFSDNNLNPIMVGDYMVINHNCNCEYCQHTEKVQILWNEDWNAYGMRTPDGRWLSGMGISSGYSILTPRGE